MKRWLVVPVAAALLAVAACTWYVMSPAWTLSGMRDAARANDAERLIGYLDLPSIKASVKAHMRTQVAMQASRKGGNPFEAMGMMMAAGMIDGMVDSMFTPEALAASMRKSDQRLTGRPLGIDVSTGDIERNGLDEFTFTTKGNGLPIGKIVFRRHYLGWRVVDMSTADVINMS